MKRKGSRLTIPQIRELFRDEKRPIRPSIFRALKRDHRIGVRGLLSGIDENTLVERHEPYRLSRLRRLESVLWSRGLQLVAGVDECGIGPMAGPVVAGAVIFHPSTMIEGIDDSKRLDEETRGRLAQAIRKHAVAFGIGMASVEEIDRINIYHAGLLAMGRAIENLPCRPDFLLTDARAIPGESTPARPISKGDARSYSIAAASIVAKDHRDRLMRELDHLLALDVASRATGVRGPRAFRDIPPRQLRDWGLYSLEARRRRSAWQP